MADDPTTTDVAAAPIDPGSLLDEITASLSDAFAEIDWAEDEISAAQQRYPDFADALFHAFALLRPPPGTPSTEAVHRAHARELLERIAAGDDLRPGTAVEVCLAMRQVSLRAPLSHEGFGLYTRMWQAAGLPRIAELSDMAGHYEAISGAAIDAAEGDARRACARADRVLAVEGCEGRHYGAVVACRYAFAGEGK